MNEEPMRDENFTRCSTMIAELLMKYKSKEIEPGGESKEDSPPSFFVFWGIENAFIIVYNRKNKMITTDKMVRRISIRCQKP